MVYSCPKQNIKETTASTSEIRVYRFLLSSRPRHQRRLKVNFLSRRHVERNNDRKDSFTCVSSYGMPCSYSFDSHRNILLIFNSSGGRRAAITWRVDSASHTGATAVFVLSRKFERVLEVEKASPKLSLRLAES